MTCSASDANTCADSRRTRTKLGLRWCQDPQQWAPFLYAIEAGDIGIAKVSTAALPSIELALCTVL